MLKPNRKNIGWTVSFIYLAYVYLGQLPFLRQLDVFSTIISSIVLIGVYAISSVLIIGAKSSAKFFIIAAIIGSAMELLSLNTGFPFGRYYYTNELGSMLGPLPVFIPLLWASLGFYAYMAGGKYGMPFLMVFTDLALDPRLSGHLWIWISTTQYFGDPITNFVGWFFTSALIILVFVELQKVDHVISYPAIVFYLLSGINECISDLYAHLIFPAVIAGVIFVVSFLILFYYTRSKNEMFRKGLENHIAS
ncbi:MAG: carotenoid biosynthesis protein [Thermoplasmatales archaeon]|nr:carotenoid biosynthesis protein [Thermoplasmatales archaeon]MCW6170534.1 carotenoid biosynthesis protein [Thermoplasmatales archaeon]